MQRYRHLGHKTTVYGFNPENRRLRPNLLTLTSTQVRIEDVARVTETRLSNVSDDVADRIATLQRTVHTVEEGVGGEWQTLSLI